MTAIMFIFITGVIFISFVAVYKAAKSFTKNKILVSVLAELERRNYEALEACSLNDIGKMYAVAGKINNTTEIINLVKSI